MSYEILMTLGEMKAAAKDAGYAVKCVLSMGKIEANGEDLTCGLAAVAAALSLPAIEAIETERFERTVVAVVQGWGASAEHDAFRAIMEPEGALENTMEGLALIRWVQETIRAARERET